MVRLFLGSGVVVGGLLGTAGLPTATSAASTSMPTTDIAPPSTAPAVVGLLSSPTPVLPGVALPAPESVALAGRLTVDLLRNTVASLDLVLSVLLVCLCLLLPFPPPPLLLEPPVAA